MANYYLDFVGLNTFIREMYGWDDPNQGSDRLVTSDGGSTGVRGPLGQNHIGIQDAGGFKSSEDIGALITFKNRLFSHDLPNTSSHFPALMLHRNGPYGWPTWKQIRIGQNTLSRRQIKENVFTYVEEPGPSIKINGADVIQRRGPIKKFIETPIISKFHPVEIRGASAVINERTGRTQLERFDIRSSFGNNIVHFNNPEIDKYYNLNDLSDEAYDEIKLLYLQGGLDAPDSPVDIFEFVKYSETVYPKQVNTNRKITRQRTNFSFSWNSTFSNRFESGVDNGFGTVLAHTTSVWPLDFASSCSFGGSGFKVKTDYGLTVTASGNGVLQNAYSSQAQWVAYRVSHEQINSLLAPAPIYSRKHDLTNLESVVAPNGMRIEGVNYGTTFGNMDYTDELPAGEAKWEAPEQSGKSPFYNSYDDFAQGVRQKGKGFSIVPEFRISQHISEMVTKGIDHKFSNMLELTGGAASSDSSDENDFYKIYSTSDFLKHFDIVKEDHKGFVEPTSIKLKCKAIKKFLPYNGFYPCQRTVDVAKQFYSSYSDYMSVASGTLASGDWLPLKDPSAPKIAFQNMLAPLFAPGVLFNAIKSGVACDYALITGSILQEPETNPENGTVFRNAENWLLQGPKNHYYSPTDVGMYGVVFNKRIPFNALVEPQRYLAQQPLVCNEPEINANHSSSVIWNGGGDNLYKMMAHNFLAEVPNFFLQDQNMSSIRSKPSNDPNVGNAYKGNIYSMRVKMYKSMHSSSAPVVSGSLSGWEVTSSWGTPQYSTASFESFTMYSRPTAFGPSSKITSSYSTHDNTGSNSEAGENYPFTPPYYYGESWCDIKFVAEETKKYTIDEIIRQCTASYWRYLHPETTQETFRLPNTNIAHVENRIYNVNAMQLSASLNLFAQGEVKNVQIRDDLDPGRTEVAVDVSNEKRSSWIIQPHWETPMLNFNHLSASDSVTIFQYNSQSVPRGMWHQYGKLEEDSSKGIFMQVTDIPLVFRVNVSGAFHEGSLKDLVGFKDEPVRLGQTAKAKIIHEAVVAIPFIEEENRRKFFSIPRATIDMATQAPSMAKDVVGESVLNMVTRMKRFIIPPSLDFVHREDIEPFAMYIFDFKHKLSQQDLTDIWQNLPPSIGTSFSTTTATIEHDLLAHELLGGGEVIKKGKIKKGNALPDKIRWMVFKAKQRSNMNYYDSIVGELGTTVAGSKKKDFTTRRLAREASDILSPEGYSGDLSYNWPYDFFSLVELVKIDAEVTLADSDEMIKDSKIKPKRGRRGLEGLAPRVKKKIKKSAIKVAKTMAKSGFGFSGGGDD